MEWVAIGRKVDHEGRVVHFAIWSGRGPVTKAIFSISTLLCHGEAESSELSDKKPPAMHALITQ